MMNPTEFENTNIPAEESPAPVYNPAPVPDQGRRVGTITMGMALICFGGLLLAGFLFPNVEYLNILQFSPVILIVLGVEILIQYFLRRGRQLKYDFLSGFVCIVLIGASLAMSVIPMGIQYFGPSRHNRESELRDELYQVYGEKLSGFDNIYSLDMNLELRYTAHPEQITVETLTAADYLSLSCYLSGEYDSAESFVKDALPVLRKMQSAKIPLSRVSFHGDTNQKDFDLYLDNSFAMNLSPEKMAKKVDITCYQEDEDVADAEEMLPEEEETGEEEPAVPGPEDTEASVPEEPDPEQEANV
jgi:hypothetical protein